jgi:hypothetical protein
LLLSYSIIVRILYKEDIYIREKDTGPRAMASTQITHVTLFKIPKEEDRAEMAKCYQEMTANATKVGSSPNQYPLLCLLLLG